MPIPERERDPRFDVHGRLRPVYVERVGRQAVAAAIAEHKAAGRPVYYMDPAYPGFVVEERADGRRFLMDEDEHGQARIVREIFSE